MDENNQIYLWVYKITNLNSFSKRPVFSFAKVNYFHKLLDTYIRRHLEKNTESSLSGCLH